MTIVNTNLNALASKYALAENQRALTSTMQQMATGKRINSSADDAAGLAISNKLSTQARSLDMAVRNANDGISMLQTADGAAGELTNMLVRMRELAVQAANDTNSTEDRTALQVEMSALQSQLGDVIGNTEWNGVKILLGEAGTSGSVTFQVGSQGTDNFNVSMTTLDTSHLSSAQSLDISTQSGATNSIATLDSAIEQVDQSRTLWGATANRLVHSADNAAQVSMNTKASVSTVLDSDYAKTTADLARAMILNEAGSAMLSQANQQPMYVLALLR